MAVTRTLLEPTQVKIVEPQTFGERLNKLSEQISRRAYEIFENNGKVFGHDLEDWFKAESEILPPLQLRIMEKEDSLTIEAETPGFSAKDLEVSLEPWRLTISGKKETKEEQKEGQTTYQERFSNELLRVIDLPSEIDSTSATATLKNGHLEMKLPKVGRNFSTRVDVKAA
jgi:HSP20 family protein